MMKVGCSIVALLLASGTVLAQQNLRDIPEASVDAELARFEVAEGFEVSLYAADPLIAKPIQINFDPAGRLWIASSVTYPQVSPNGEPEDRIVLVEDLDADGVADRSTLFADDLLIPNGAIPGNGGVYVAQAGELLHLRDIDGDRRADEREVLLSGFGTQDTHHTLHGLTWGNDGWLYLLQGYYIATHVETLYGPRRLNGGGAWRYHPGTGRLEVYSRGLVNPWGIQFDRWGQTFQTDGAGGEGINYSFPGAAFLASPGEMRFLPGLNPRSPKLCGIEVVSGRHFPEEWQGHVLANDFRANRMNRFQLDESGSGFVSTKLSDLIRSSHVSFRPIDIAMGPDGALYLADWYSPIIQHGEVSFRDPRRDHTHGRIWRITAKERPLVERVDLTQASTESLLASLKSPEDYTRRQARRVLVERRAAMGAGDATLENAMQRWTAALDPSDPEAGHHLLELHWTYLAMDRPNEAIRDRLLVHGDHRIRAAAVRGLGDWRDGDGLALMRLQAAVEDSHPRVRLEAVRALVGLDSLAAVRAVARALDHPLDDNLDYAIWRAFRELEGRWLPGVQAASFDFDGNLEHLMFALNSLDTADMVGPLIRLAQGPSLDAGRAARIWKLVSRVGTSEQLGQVWQAIGEWEENPVGQVELLEGILRSKRERGVRAVPDAKLLEGLIGSADLDLSRLALEAAGELRVRGVDQGIRSKVRSGALGDQLMPVAMRALGAYGGWPNEAAINARLAQVNDVAAEAELASLLVRWNPGLAVTHASRLARDYPDRSRDWMPLIRAFLAVPRSLSFLEVSLRAFPPPATAARAMLNEVGASGRDYAGLSGILLEASGYDSNWGELSGEARKVLVDVARDSGDRERGQELFEGATLMCRTCHAVNGVGGKVGPDLSSIGASAPMDYLLESLVDPNVAIKEGYGTINVDTKDGRSITGVKLQESGETLVLRGILDDEVLIPKSEIAQRSQGRSLMPEGLVDSLSRQQLLDLLSYLGDLGRN